MTNGHWRGWAKRKMSRECDDMWKTSHYHPFTAPGWVIVGVAGACVMTGMLVGGWRTRSIWWHLSAWVAPLLQTILFINSIILIFINTNLLLMSTKCCSFTKDSICLWQHQPEPALSWGNPLWCLFNPSKLLPSSSSSSSPSPTSMSFNPDVNCCYCHCHPHQTKIIIVAS